MAEKKKHKGAGPTKIPHVSKEDGLTPKQRKFCTYYVETGNATQAAKRAGYSERSASALGRVMLTNDRVVEKIRKLQAPKEAEEEKHIATSQEVMQFFTDMMQGKIKDQFGIDASNADKIKAAQEIAKRTVDIDNRAAGKADGVMQIKLDWRRDQ